MISGAVISGGTITNTNTFLQLCPRHHLHLHLPSPTTGRGPCSSCASFPNPKYRWASLWVSSFSGTFRTWAAVEDERRYSTPQEEEEHEGDHKTFYELLGISADGSFSDIKRAYKHLARKYHPDVCPPDQTEKFTRRFIEVQEAYETLSDPGRRALYDRDLARGLHLAFSARRRNEEGFMEKSEWRNCWQNQVAELKKRSLNKDQGKNMSWGARMRRQMDESSTD